MNEFDAEGLRQIADLHRKNLSSGFLSTLGDRVLALLYREIQRYPGGMLIAAESHGQIAGFIAGVDHTGRFYRWFLRRNLLRGACVMLPRLFSLRTIRRVIETMRYSGKQSTDDLPDAELLSIAVDSEYRRQGTAELCYRALESHFASVGIERFRIVVGKQLEPAMKFYEKMGAVRTAEVEVHAGQGSWVLVQQVPALESTSAS